MSTPNGTSIHERAQVEQAQLDARRDKTTTEETAVRAVFDAAPRKRPNAPVE